MYKSINELYVFESKNCIMIDINFMYPFVNYK